MFATPPRPGQRRLGIVVAAGVTTCIVNHYFCVRGRTCVIDVCWEEQKFRVICSHLNPGSVMHLYVKDLEDLGMLVTSREKDAHVHICVDTQTGLGTSGTWCHQQYHGPATSVTHRAPKQRLLECFIKEHQLTATNTFSNDDEGKLDIYTCNYT